MKPSESLVLRDDNLTVSGPDTVVELAGLVLPILDFF